MWNHGDVEDRTLPRSLAGVAVNCRRISTFRNLRIYLTHTSNIPPTLPFYTPDSYLTTNRISYLARGVSLLSPNHSRSLAQTQCYYLTTTRYTSSLADSQQAPLRLSTCEPHSFLLMHVFPLQWTVTESRGRISLEGEGMLLWLGDAYIYTSLLYTMRRAIARDRFWITITTNHNEI